ncbi:MAG: type VI secretion system tip protein TssI/VgrG [Planctomycetota bacterium]|nr:type VI secretion system tip protein TssI/VgrG [Planctomycetota bacterium]
MLDAATQQTRQLAVSTVLGKDVLLLQTLTGREAVSDLFEYRLEMLSANSSLDVAGVVGTPVSVRLSTKDHPDRWFHGHVSRFGYAGQDEQAVVYEATIVPWLWFLTQTTDCRIFQKKSSKQIIEQIFTEAGFTDFDLAGLSRNYPPREYCVQCRETDFNFVSRLMEEEGIFYFFRHEQQNHTLLLADQTSAYKDLPDNSVEFPNPDGVDDSKPRLLSWDHRVEFRPGKVTQTDYNFTKPKQAMVTKTQGKMKVAQTPKFEIYDYPGNYSDRGKGTPLTTVRQEQEEAAHDIAGGTSNYRSFTPGGKFQVQRHRNHSEEGKAYVLTAVSTSATVGDSYSNPTGGGGDAEVTNRFEAIPATTVFRSRRKTHRPVVEGPQTAVIVGPGGEEIYTDEHGRVKVQFHWDREGKRDENSSCWMRVSQMHAGQGWGYMDLPRIHEEVIVDFLEGDPDRPIVTGRVYNGDNKPPFNLPGEKTRRGNKTKTYKGGGFNEMSMDDTPGKEQIRIHGQHNMDARVENDETHSIGKNRTADVGIDEKMKVGNNQTLAVGVNKTVSVGMNHNETVGANQTVNVGSNQTSSIGMVKNETVGLMSNEIVGVAKTLNVGAAYSVISGGIMNTAVGFMSAEEVGMNKTLVVGGDHSISTGGESSLSVGKEYTVKVQDKIQFVCGNSKLTLSKSGDVEIECVNFSVKATATIKESANTSMNVEAGVLTLQARTNAEFKSSAVLDIHSALVKINT